MFEILTLQKRPSAARVVARVVVPFGKGEIETVQLPRATEFRAIDTRSGAPKDDSFKIEPHPPDIRWVSDNLCLSVVSDGGIDKIGTYLFNRRTGKDRRLTSRAADLQADVAFLDGNSCFSLRHRRLVLRRIGDLKCSSLNLANGMTGIRCYLRFDLPTVNGSNRPWNRGRAGCCSRESCRQ